MDDHSGQAMQALRLRASGYQATETVEEFCEKDGELVLTKRKVTTKHIPPEMSAVRALLEGSGAQVCDMTDEQLEAERLRLMGMLAEKDEQTESNKE